VEIRRFRGLSELDLDQLGRFNILLGANDFGKTSVLEAVFLLTGITNPPLPLKVQGLRAVPTRKFDDLKLLFHGLDLDRPIDLMGHSSGAVERRQLKISAPRTEFEIRADTLPAANGGNGSSRILGHSRPSTDQASSAVPLGSRVLHYKGTIHPRQGDSRSLSGTLHVVDESNIQIKSSVKFASKWPSSCPSCRQSTRASPVSARAATSLTQTSA